MACLLKKQHSVALSPREGCSSLPCRDSGGRIKRRSGPRKGCLIFPSARLPDTAVPNGRPPGGLKPRRYCQRVNPGRAPGPAAACQEKARRLLGKRRRPKRAANKLSEMTARGPVRGRRRRRSPGAGWRSPARDGSDACDSHPRPGGRALSALSV
ncbi:hypothetical protein SKAU_G00033960 [Synaphobranchus kaupii]|uniref:Uncharacterized protein n=1 Tax=Synaphobranchus kaupii TaxID=118154 RepID=A0A9Q1JEH9_SYNKA|nr:hypothetical protein SKAU_G00033960 [Synaphobranchus kaupii]